MIGSKKRKENELKRGKKKGLRQKIPIFLAL
jgi:hypothetical protein